MAGSRVAVCEHRISALRGLAVREGDVLLLEDLEHIDFCLLFHRFLLVVGSEEALILALRRLLWQAFRGTMTPIAETRLLRDLFSALVRGELVDDHVVILVDPVVLGRLLLHLLILLVLLGQNLQDVHDILLRWLALVGAV